MRLSLSSYPQNIFEKFEMRVISIDKKPYNKTVVEEPLGIARRKEGWKEKRRRKRIFVTYAVTRGMKKRRKNKAICKIFNFAMQKRTAFAQAVDKKRSRRSKSCGESAFCCPRRALFVLFLLG